MAVSVLTVANFFLDRAADDSKPIDPLKLQKLIYISHGWNLAFTGNPLIREGFAAWRYGPVVGELYRQFRDFRSRNITRKAPAPKEDIPEESCDILNQVWEKYKDLSPLALSAMTHEKGSAWSQIYDPDYIGFNSPDIPDVLIRNEFLDRLKTSEGTRA